MKNGIIMDKKILKMAVAVMRDLSLTEISIKDGETEITMKRDNSSIPAAKSANTDNKNIENVIDVIPEEDFPIDAHHNIISVTAPMIGIFKASDSSDNLPFVSIGSKIDVGDTLCAIESMKMINYIPSDYKGTIVDICASDGSLVEYGQTMFKIDIND